MGSWQTDKNNEKDTAMKSVRIMIILCATTNTNPSFHGNSVQKWTKNLYFEPCQIKVVFKGLHLSWIIVIKWHNTLKNIGTNPHEITLYSYTDVIGILSGATPSQYPSISG